MGRARIVRVDVEPDNGVLAAFESRGLPTYLIFRDGVEVDRLAPLVIDWMTKERLRRLIQSALAESSNDSPSLE